MVAIKSSHSGQQCFFSILAFSPNVHIATLNNNEYALLLCIYTHFLYGIMRSSVLFGFATVAVLIVVVGALSLHKIRAANDSITTIVEVNNTKIELAYTMREAVRLRQISLNSMLSMDDPFGRDEELLRFYQHAFPYRHAREQLLALPTNEDERIIHVHLTRQTQVSQPLNQQAALMLAEDGPPEEIRAAINLAQLEQDKLLALLDRLVELQRRYAQEAVTQGRRDFRETMFLVITLGGIVILSTLGVGIFVARMVAKTSKELILKNKELAIAYEQAEEATQSKSAFLATMSHEIRTPLTAIIGFAETSLYSDQSMADRHRAINIIIRSGKHLLQIINDILDLSKIEANKLETERVSLSPFQLLTEIEPFVQPQAAEKGIAFGVNYIFPLPEQILSDPLRLKQILLNLCGNALKFTDSGHIHINVSFDNRDDEICFEVADSGIGMDAEQIEKVFKPFNQGDSSTTRKYGGTGLGLSVSRRLAQALGGSITVQSKPGYGSSFKLSVSAGTLAGVGLVHDEQHIPAQMPTAAKPLPGDTLEGTVLLAEDNRTNQLLLSMMLRHMGAEILLAENGRVAVDRAQDSNVDLILMDMQMPEMDGMEAVRRLREKGYNRPIVALTANAMVEDRKRCLEAGCDNFLSKPVDKDLFFEVVSSYLKPKVPDEPGETPIRSLLLEENSAYFKVVVGFINDLPGELHDIEKALQQEDWDKLKYTLHQLKGAGGGIGFPEVSNIAASMEFQAFSQNTEELNRLFKELTNVYERIVAGAPENDSAARLPDNTVSL